MSQNVGAGRIGGKRSLRSARVNGDLPGSVSVESRRCPAFRPARIGWQVSADVLGGPRCGILDRLPRHLYRHASGRELHSAPMVKNPCRLRQSSTISSAICAKPTASLLLRPQAGACRAAGAWRTFAKICAQFPPANRSIHTRTMTSQPHEPVQQDEIRRNLRTLHLIPWWHFFFSRPPISVTRKIGCRKNVFYRITTVPFRAGRDVPPHF